MPAKALLLFTLLIGIYLSGKAQIDSIRFKNGDLIIGETKSMERGVLKIETDYSDKDFQIEWKEVVWISSQTNFHIITKDGEHYFSIIKSLNDSISKVITENNQTVTIRTQSIVSLDKRDAKFKDRFDARIDIGLDIAKAKNLRNFSTSSFVGYKADKWSTDGSVNRLTSTQDSTEKIQRSDGIINFRVVLSGQWYSIVTVSFLSNTEQKLDMRANTQLGLGYYFIRTNSVYWGTKFGANRNFEEYSSDPETYITWEGFLGTELNLYDIGDFSLTFDFMAYPGIDEKKRFRSDAGLNLKYDLPLDFYIRLGGTINYDNRPAEGASEMDYVFQVGFGWEW